MDLELEKLRQTVKRLLKPEIYAQLAGVFDKYDENAPADEEKKASEASILGERSEEVRRANMERIPETPLAPAADVEMNCSQMQFYNREKCQSYK
eukprot:5780929-Amphidinium_carterae.1